MAYYTVKRDMASITLGIQRDSTRDYRFQRTRAFFDTTTKAQGWATNMRLDEIKLILSLQVFELSSGNEVLSKEELCELPANSSIDLFDITLPEVKIKGHEEPLVVSARLLNPLDRTEVVARCTNWPQPYRYLDMPKPLLQIRVENDKICVRTMDVPVKGLWFYVDEVDEVKFDDNCVDLVPQDDQVITAKGLGGKSLHFRYYGMT